MPRLARSIENKYYWKAAEKLAGAAGIIICEGKQVDFLSIRAYGCEWSIHRGEW